MIEPSGDLLDDLATRFIFSAPPQHIEDFTQMMFLVETAYWYYEDQLREVTPDLRHFSKLPDFAAMLFTRCHLLARYKDQLGTILDAWRQYKRAIPVYGAILMDYSLEQVLLLRGFQSASGWGFPRGKINRNEGEAECATREVLEETSFDIESHLCEDDFLQEHMEGKLHKLYIITGLDPATTIFAPKCKSEIGAYAWHRLTELPCTKQEENFVTENGARHKFFMVSPFVKKLRKWVARNRGRATAGPVEAPAAPPAVRPVTARFAAADPGPAPAPTLVAPVAPPPRPPPAAAAAVAAAVAASAAAAPVACNLAYGAVSVMQRPAEGGPQQSGAAGVPAAAAVVSFRGQVSPRLVVEAGRQAGRPLREFRFDREAILLALASAG